MYKYAVFGRLNEFLGDIMAENSQAALAKAILEYPHAVRVIMVKPGGDLGVEGLH